MRRPATALLCLALATPGLVRAADPAPATIRGAVKVMKKGFFGKIGASEDRSGVVVYVTGYEEPPPNEQAALAQQNERFAPRILPIVAGQTVSFPNRDRLYHNVFSVSPTLSFDLGQYKSTDPPRAQRFEKPGLVPVYCNIHPQMISYVVVLEKPGKLALNAWMPGAQRVTEALELAPGGEFSAELVLEQTQTIPPHLRKDGTPYPPPPDYGND